MPPTHQLVCSHGWSQDTRASASSRQETCGMSTTDKSLEIKVWIFKAMASDRCWLATFLFDLNLPKEVLFYLTMSWGEGPCARHRETKYCTADVLKLRLGHSSLQLVCSRLHDSVDFSDLCGGYLDLDTTGSHHQLSIESFWNCFDHYT